MRFKRIAAIAATLSLLAFFTAASAYHGRPPCPFDPGARRPMDVVICLDTSNSMDHLIDSARARLWDVVTQLSRARPTPHLRVGLLTYGSPDVSSADRGWVVRQVDLTDDLDTFYSRLMSLRTNGGEEFVGWVLRDAVHTMTWSNHPDALRIIFVAGNESADQCSSTVNFRDVAESAKARGIAINAIFCGSEAQGRNEGWLEVARHGGGTYSAIDMTAGTVQLRTPFDDELYRLNTQLNATYVPYGRSGEAGIKNMRLQDAESARLGAQTAASRAEAKASVVYRNSGWDLVDASQQEGFRLDSLKEEDLPAAMQALPADQREAYLDTVRAERASLQEKIREIGQKRSRFLQEQQSGGNPALDAALRDALKRQAEQRGFKFEE